MGNGINQESDQEDNGDDDEDDDYVDRDYTAELIKLYHAKRQLKFD